MTVRGSAKSKARAAGRWRNQAMHHAAELRRVACQLRKAVAPTLALKIAAGRIERIADEIERAAMVPDCAAIAGSCRPLNDVEPRAAREGGVQSL